MPQIIYLSGMEAIDRAAIVRLLSDRGYRIGVIVSGADDIARFWNGNRHWYLAAGASCVSMLANHAAAVMLLRDLEQGQIQRLFADCHLIFSNHNVTGCSDIIEAIPSGAAPRYAGDPRLRAVIGAGCSVPGVACFAHDTQDELCNFIESRYLKPHLSAAVLAGGKSHRLGTNKALLAINGTTLIGHVLHTARQFTETVRIIANDSEAYQQFNVPVIGDIMPGGGPLSGIHAALTISPTEYVLVLSCDMPLLDPSHIKPLISAYPGYDITLYKHQNFEPLCAIYRRTCIGALEELIAHGEYRIIDLFPTLNVKVIRTDEPTPFTNINTWADYQRLNKR
ncbi:MAG: molybdenum cofactor guanylyltransferase [Desulfobacterota bacterium]|nr:molybdenum cofactor guanylyltransferase [Thermodesulfobacteriota bacterium]